MNLIATTATLTRALQGRRPQRPLRGITRLGTLLHRWLPPYEGVVRLPDGFQMQLDSRIPSERAILFYGDYHHSLSALLRQQLGPGAHCLDIGANLGFYTLLMAQAVGPTGRVAAFEANPAMVAKIQQQVALNAFPQVELVPQALDQQPGRVTFYISESPGKSSLHAAHVPQPQSVLHVTATTLDAYIEAAGWPRLDLIKSDIEGNDCRGLLGGERVIRRFRPFIVFEYWRSTPAETAYAAVNLLESAGYRLEILLHNGQRLPFAGKVPAGYKHVDVVALPPG